MLQNQDIHTSHHHLHKYCFSASSVTVGWSGDMWGLGESGSALGSGSGAFNNTTAFDPENNLTLTCAARNIQSPVELPYPTTLVDTMKALLYIFFLVMFLLSISLNILVIFLVAKYKRLQTTSFGFALQIVMINLLISLLIYLVGFANSVASQWLFGEYACAAAGTLFFIANIIRSLLMFVFVIDRFLSVFMPFAYPKHQHKVIVILSIFSWGFSVVISIVPIPQILDCYTFSYTFWICSFSPQCSEVCSHFGSIFYSLVTLPVTVIPIALYIILYIKARKAKKVLATASDGVKQDWKATITFFLLFLSIFLVTLPSITLNAIVNRLYETSAEEPPAIYVLSVLSLMILSLLPVTDPIVILRNNDVRQILFQKKKISNSKIQSCDNNMKTSAL